MAGRDIRAGAAFVELFIVKSKFNRGLKAAQAKLRAFSVAVSEVGRRLTALSASLAVPLIAATRLFSGFSDSMLEVKAITGATGETFEQLTDTAKELGRTTSFTAKEVAQGMGVLARSGKNATEILRMIPDMLNLARATTTDLALATKTATETMNAFGLGIDQTTRVVDVLTKGTLSASMDMDDLSEALKKVSTFACFVRSL